MQPAPNTPWKLCTCIAVDYTWSKEGTAPEDLLEAALLFVSSDFLRFSRHFHDINSQPKILRRTEILIESELSTEILVKIGLKQPTADKQKVCYTAIKYYPHFIIWLHSVYKIRNTLSKKLIIELGQNQETYDRFFKI